MTELRFEEMKEEDLDQVVALEELAFSTPWSKQGFASSLCQKDALFLCVWAEDHLAGYCGLLQSFDEADVMNVVINERDRRKGIGEKMLRELMRRGNERGVKRFTLEVRVSNAPAIHLYEKLGFENAGIRKRFYEKPTEDAMIMWTGAE